MRQVYLNCFFTESVSDDYKIFSYECTAKQECQLCMTRQEEKQMKRIAKFHKVSKERFTADWIDTFAQSQEEAEKVYEAIRLPKRATAGSAGYDFSHRQNLF